MDPKEALQGKLNDAYAAVVSKAPAHPELVSYLMLDLCRSADFNYVYLPPHRLTTYGFWVQAGWHRALALFLPKCSAPRGLAVPLMATSQERTKWADSLLLALGELETAKLVLEHCRDGLACLSEVNGGFVAEYSTRFKGVEKVEKADYEWVVERMPGWYEMRIAQRNRWSNILKQMRKRVYIYKNHFLGYSCTPDIDEYFSRESHLYSQRLVGYDAFPEDATFGGIPFRVYREATRHVVEWTLKHQQFMEQLYAGNKRKLNPRNLISLWWREDDLVRELGFLLRLTTSEARVVVEALVLRNRDTEFLNGHGLPQPPYVSVGNGWLLRSMAGALGNPFSFVLRQLHTQHRADYSREHKRREDIFRGQLNDLFADSRLIKVERSVDLTQNGRKMTDLDGIILDPQTETIALFQLKWQDTFGGSMTERRSKESNLKGTCDQWIEAVLAWLDSNGIRELWNRLQLRRQQRFDIRRVFLFVLGRNYSQFSGNFQPDGRAAWGNWYQVRRLYETTEMDLSDPLGWLHQQLIDDSPFRKTSEILVEPEQEVSVGTSTIRIRNV